KCRGFELEAKIVAEGAVQTKVRVGGAVEVAYQLADDREQARLPAAFFFGEALGGALHLTHQAAPLTRQLSERFDAAQGRLDGIQQQLTALVERLDLERKLPTSETERRVDEAHVPPRVAPGVFVARRQQHPALGIEPLDQRL